MLKQINDHLDLVLTHVRVDTKYSFTTLAYSNTYAISQGGGLKFKMMQHMCWPILATLVWPCGVFLGGEWGGGCLRVCMKKIKFCNLSSGVLQIAPTFNSRTNAKILLWQC